MFEQASGGSPSHVLDAVFKEMGNSLVAKQDGSTVALDLPRPSNFDELVAHSAAAVQRAQKRSNELNNMKQVCLAMHNYHSAYKQFPWQPLQETHNADLSWRVRVLPFIEQQAMWEEIEVTLGPNDPPNSQFANAMPEVFGDKEKGLAAYVIGGDDMPLRFRDIRDGTANTIAFIYAPMPEGENWMKVRHISREDAVKLIRSSDEPTIVAFYDGSVTRLDSDTEESLLRALMTPDGRELIGDDFRNF